MFEGGAAMPSLRERLKQPGTATGMPGPQESATAPDTVVEPSHAATRHNASRREVDMVKVHYGSESCIALPYAYLATIDMPEPGKLVLEFASRTVTIEGIRLDALMAELMSRHVAMVRANDNAAFDTGGREPVIRKVTVSKPQ